MTRKTSAICVAAILLAAVTSGCKKTGVFRLRGGGTYSGEITFFSHVPSGKGTMRKKGAAYSGQWRDGFHHGEGTHWYADGRIREGTWREGAFETGTDRTPLPSASGEDLPVRPTLVGKYTDGKLESIRLRAYTSERKHPELPAARVPGSYAWVESHGMRFKMPRDWLRVRTLAGDWWIDPSFSALVIVTETDIERFGENGVAGARGEDEIDTPLSVPISDRTPLDGCGDDGGDFDILGPARELWFTLSTSGERETIVLLVAKEEVWDMFRPALDAIVRSTKTSHRDDDAGEFIR